MQCSSDRCPEKCIGLHSDQRMGLGARAHKLHTCSALFTVLCQTPYPHLQRHRHTVHFLGWEGGGCTWLALAGIVCCACAQCHVEGKAANPATSIPALPPACSSWCEQPVQGQPVTQRSLRRRQRDDDTHSNSLLLLIGSTRKDVTMARKTKKRGTGLFWRQNDCLHVYMRIREKT